MRNFLTCVIFAAALGCTFAGFRAGEWYQDRKHEKELAKWGCAGYEMQSGDWTKFPGATCQVPLVESEDIK